jgi:hypothetical protein
MHVLATAKAVVIRNESDYAAADAAIAAIKSAQKAAEAKRTSLVKPLNDTVKRINAEFRPVEEALEAALAAYRRPMTAYQTEQARLRAEAEAKARAERERIEAEARAKAQAELDAARKARAEAEALRSAAADAFEAALAEDRVADAEAEAEARMREAQQAIREGQMAVATIAADAPLKVTGSASKTYTIWDYEITDESAVPLRFRPVDHKALAAEVRATKGESNIPGVRIFSRVEVK